MSRVDEFLGTCLTITRIDWRDGKGTSWGDFVPDPSDSTKAFAAVTGSPGGEAIAEVHYPNEKVRVYAVKVGQKVIWDSVRRTYTFPR